MMPNTSLQRTRSRAAPGTGPLNSRTLGATQQHALGKRDA